MRDKITHFYFGINYKVVWSVVKKELPGIEPVIKKVLIDSGIKKSADITLIGDSKRVKRKPITAKKRAANK